MATKYGLTNQLDAGGITVPASGASTPTNIPTGTGTPAAATDRPWSNLTSGTTHVSFLASTSGAKTILFDMGTNIVCSGIGITEHNVATIVATLYRDVNGTWTATAEASVTPSSGTTTFYEFSRSDSGYVRLVITPVTGEILRIGELWLGEVEEFDRGLVQGFTPPRLARRYETVTSTSRNGLLIGSRSYQQPTRVTLQMQGLTTTFIEGGWEDIKTHLRGEDGSMWLEWDSTGHARDGFFGFAATDIQPTQYHPISNTATLALVGQ